MLLKVNKNGIYCAQADVYIDPWKPVKRAIITHGHSDHARQGMGLYVAQKDNEVILKHRLGNDISFQGYEYGQGFSRNGVNFSFHSAAHVLGSAQVRVEYRGEIWVVSGDYKTEDDGFSGAFEPVRCHHFITESTFGLPVFQFEKQEVIAREINAWWEQNRSEKRQSLLFAYSLGKAQRICKLLDQNIGPVYLHGAIHNLNSSLLHAGYDLPDFPYLDPAISKKELAGALILAPPSAANSAWTKKLEPYSEAFASGWMQVRGMRRRRAADRGFVLSDHADWNGLNEAVSATGAENIYVTHGYSDVFSKWLQEKGLNAHVLRTQFDDEAS